MNAARSGACWEVWHRQPSCQQARETMRQPAWKKFAILPGFSGILVCYAKKSAFNGKKNHFDGYGRQEDSGGPAEGRPVIAGGDRRPGRIVAVALPAQNSPLGKSRGDRPLC